tara:strand:- start:2620 stop:3105 length:486 start_codon:yes stop_codon:yes gene_type:complete
MNWYVKLSQSVRYFRVTLPAGTMIMRAIKPEHIAALYDATDIEEISREEAAAWDASGGAIQHVFSRLENGRLKIFAGKDESSSLRLLAEKANKTYPDQGLEVFYRPDSPKNIKMSFGDWADHHDEVLAMFEKEGYTIDEWDYEVGGFNGYARVEGSRIGDI